MKSKACLAALVVCSLAACRDSGHAAGAEMLSHSGDRVMTVDGNAITAAEASAFAASHPDATRDELVAREVLARQALAEDVDVEFARKRAMVDVFLDEEIEAKVTTADVTPEEMKVRREEVRRELNAPGGYEVVAVRIFATELLQGAPSPQRREELKGVVSSTAARLHKSIPKTDGLETVNSLDLSWVPPEVTVRILELRVVDASVQQPVKGWSRAPRLAAALAELPDGGLSPVFVTNGSPVFGVRKSRVEAHVADPETVEREATSRALAHVRAQRVRDLLGELREKSTIVPHPEAFEEQM